MISHEGVGSEIYENYQKNINPTIEELIRWGHAESRGGAVADKLESMFSTFKIVEHYNNFFTFNVSRDNYSIGFLFGMMEDTKEELEISEYSVNQTTLEQIFNNFSKEQELINNRRRSTMKKKSEKKKKGGKGPAIKAEEPRKSNEKRDLINPDEERKEQGRRV